MGDVNIQIRLMPESLEMIEGIKASLSKIPEVKKIEEVPIAFGLKALVINATVPDAEGAQNKLEKTLKSIPGVSSMETLSVSRLL
jgi:elongation factor 1-beta